MATYLQYGSKGDDVKKLQETLNKAGYNAGTVDGIFGNNTANALKQYQAANGLKSDGIVGDSTLKKLYGTSSAAQVQPTVKMPTYTPQYTDQMNELFDKLLNRDKFSYDAASDPLYQQYRQIYQQQGKLAMQDTMGQAAALTGGYGSSYGQAVGQQQYDAYLQKLNEVVPELYGQAYAQYEAEGQDMQNRYSMLAAKDAQDYDRYQNELAQFYNRQDTNYGRLIDLISSTGYTPTAQELADAGMSQSQADSYRKAYQQAIASRGSGGSGGGGDVVKKTVNAKTGIGNGVGSGVNIETYKGIRTTILQTQRYNGTAAALSKLADVYDDLTASQKRDLLAYLGYKEVNGDFVKI